MDRLKSYLTPLLVATMGLGFSLPAAAQYDLAGKWSASLHEDRPHRIPGPELGDYTGIPVNEAARLKARTWDASIHSLPEQQARPHPAQYSLRGPANFRFDEVIDPISYRVLAYTINGLWGAVRTIWMDGRPHPSERALHTWTGFSTGEWVGRTLKVTTTHLKAGYIQRNGVPASELSRMTEHFVRHGELLVTFTAIEDPVYLDEPFVRSTTFVWNPELQVGSPTFLEIVDEVVSPGPGYVPSYPMGTHHTDFAELVGLPYEATQGGAETLYPEYVQKIREMTREAQAAGGVEP